jgi:hypothetical protein
LFLVEESVIKAVCNPEPDDIIWKWFDKEGPIIRAEGKICGDTVVFRAIGIQFVLDIGMVQEID